MRICEKKTYTLAEARIDLQNRIYTCGMGYTLAGRIVRVFRGRLQPWESRPVLTTARHSDLTTLSLLLRRTLSFHLGVPPRNARSHSSAPRLSKICKDNPVRFWPLNKNIFNVLKSICSCTVFQKNNENIFLGSISAMLCTAP